MPVRGLTLLTTGQGCMGEGQPGAVGRGGGRQGEGEV